MTNKCLSFEQEKEMHIFYCNQHIGTRRADFFVEDCVMVEIKAVELIQKIHKNQPINYLQAYNISNGLLMNFGAVSLDFMRLYNKKFVIPGNNSFK